MTETCGWQRRAAPPLGEQSVFSSVGRASGYRQRGVAGGARLRVRWVAAGAGSLDGAPEQANAPDRRHEGSHVHQWPVAAGDWRG
jgi:hypothetical protein